MGKLRLKLQAIMPTAWYRRLKTELGIRMGGSHHGAISYKRWSSPRKHFLSSSKKLLKASPLLSAPPPSSTNLPKLDDRESSLVLPSATPESDRPPQAHTSIPLVEQRECQHADPVATIAQVASACPDGPEMHRIQERESETTIFAAKESHSGALPSISSAPLPQQAPSLSSPFPLSDKSFQLNLQELNSKLKALNYEERRTYYSSPIFAATTPDGVVSESLNLDFAADNPVELDPGSLVARKLFSEDAKLFPAEASRSSYGSASFTGQSYTSSEDTAFDKASSSTLWERDFSSLPSEGSELLPTMEKIRDTVACLGQKSRKPHKEASMKQRRRHKEGRGKLPKALEECNHFDGEAACLDTLCQCRADKKVPSLEKLKAALAGSRTCAVHPLLANELQSMQVQSENSFSARRPEATDFVRHRRSVSNESLFLENIGIKSAFSRFSPWQQLTDVGFEKFSPSDSAFSDSELESSRSHRSNAIHQRYCSTVDHRSQPAKQSFYFHKNHTPSPLYDETYSDFLSSARRQHPASLPRPSLLKSKSTACRSSHSSTCDNDRCISSSTMGRLDGDHHCSFQCKSCSEARWGAPSKDQKHSSESLLLGSARSGLSMSMRRLFGGWSNHNQLKARYKNGKASEASPASSGRSKLSKVMSTISSDNDDYDGDVSIRSYNDPSMTPIDACMLNTETSACDSWAAGNQKTPSKRSAHDDHEILHGLSSTSSFSKMYSNHKGDEEDCGVAVSPVKSPISADALNLGHGNEPDSARSVGCRSTRSWQSSGRGQCTLIRGPACTRELSDGKHCMDNTASFSKREMDEPAGNTGMAAMMKSGSQREQLIGFQHINDVEELTAINGKEDKEGEASKKGLPVKSGSLNEGVGNCKKQNAEKAKVYESFAMVKCSNNPCQDFKQSMMEMVLHKKLHESLDLVELLQCYLSLNAPQYHDIIVKAFIDLWSDLFRPSV